MGNLTKDAENSPITLSVMSYILRSDINSWIGVMSGFEIIGVRIFVCSSFSRRTFKTRESKIFKINEIRVIRGRNAAFFSVFGGTRKVTRVQIMVIARFFLMLVIRWLV